MRSSTNSITLLRLIEMAEGCAEEFLIPNFPSSIFPHISRDNAGGPQKLDYLALRYIAEVVTAADAANLHPPVVVRGENYVEGRDVLLWHMGNQVIDCKYPAHDDRGAICAGLEAVDGFREEVVQRNLSGAWCIMFSILVSRVGVPRSRNAFVSDRVARWCAG